MTEETGDSLPAGITELLGMPVAELTPVKFGAELKKLRENAKYSLEQLAALTRIRPEFLQALENGHFSELPSAVFARGFVRNICRYVASSRQIEFVNAFNVLTKTLPPALEVARYTERQLPKTSQDIARTINDMRSSELVSEEKEAEHAAPVSLSSQAPRRRKPVEKPAAEEADAPAKQTAVFAGWQNPIVIGSSLLVLITAVLVLVKVLQVNQGRHMKIAERGDQATAAYPKAVDPVAAPKPPPAEDYVGTEDETGGAQDLASAQQPASAQLENQGSAVITPTEPRVETAEQSKTNQPVTTEAAAPAAAKPGAQLLEVRIRDQEVKVRLKLDKADWETVTLAPNAEGYKYEFKDAAQVLVFDAGSVDIAFNGQPLGNLGRKGRVRRLSFASKAPANLLTTPQKM